MTDPTDNLRRGRPERRFSQLHLPARRATRTTPVPDLEQEAPSFPLKAPVAKLTSDAPDEARVAKVMSRAGLCSRRDAEAWIRAGRVAVNGAIIESPALNIGPDDTISVDGQAIDKAEKTRLFLFHKTRGLVTTSKDPEGRPTIFDALPEDLPRLMTVGRLDINTEGLLLLTNDGGLSRALELPATGWLRRYRVRANGSVDQAMLDDLAGGITIEGVDYAGIEATMDRQQGANVWLTMGLREGKNREIKKVLEHLGLFVNRLIRVSFGPFQLGDLAEGEVEEVKTRVLREQLGTVLARNAGVDFDGPVTATVVTRDVRQAKGDERRAKEAAPGRSKGPERTPEKGRRHVSALRADRVEALAEGPRRKTARSATEDRKGRAVAVERITTSVRKRASAEPGRNERRFERDRREEGPAERPQRAGRPAGGRTLRESDNPLFAGKREARPEGRERGHSAGERPRFRPKTDATGERSFAGPRRAEGEFKPRREGPFRPVRHGHDAERAPRAAASETRDRSDRAARRERDPDRASRAPSGAGRDRPDRGAGRERDPERTSRAPSGEGRREPGVRFARASRFEGAAPGRTREGRDGGKPAQRARHEDGKPGGFKGRPRPAGSSTRPSSGAKSGGSDRPKGGSRPGGGGRSGGAGRPGSHTKR